MTNATALDSAEAMVEVFARRGSRISDDTAERVYREAQRLPETQRTAENLLKLARSPKSEIHDLFIWDDKEAAEKFREEQARHLMRSVQVRVIVEDSVKEYHAFFSVTVEEEEARPMAYVQYQAVSETERFRRQVLSRARRDLDAFRSRYQQYADLFQEEAPEIVEVLKVADSLNQ